MELALHICSMQIMSWKSKRKMCMKSAWENVGGKYRVGAEEIIAKYLQDVLGVN